MYILYPQGGSALLLKCGLYIVTSFPRGQYGKGGKVTSQLKQSKTKRNTSDRHDLSQIKADVNNDKPYGSTCGNGRGREDDRLGASDTLSQLKT